MILSCASKGEWGHGGLSSPAPRETWDLHVEAVLQCTLQQNLDMIGNTIRYLKQHMEVAPHHAGISHDTSPPPWLIALQYGPTWFW